MENTALEHALAQIDENQIFVINTSEFLNQFNIVVKQRNHLTGHSGYMNPNVDDSTCTNCIGINCGITCIKTTDFIIESATIKKGINPLYNMIKWSGCSIVPDYTTLKKWETDIDEWLAEGEISSDLLLPFVLDSNGTRKEYYYDFYKFSLSDIKKELFDEVYIVQVNDSELIFDSKAVAKSIARSLNIPEVKSTFKINVYGKPIISGKIETII